ncbi:MAG: hypothetical protein P4L51_09710 [Puia sp.]|nr:hypothetical protein [Puia sp.]
MSGKKIKGKLMEIALIAFAWLTVLSLIFFFILKLKLLKQFFH